MEPRPVFPGTGRARGKTRFYGRGASDSKSQLWTLIEALRAWKAVKGGFPAEIVGIFPTMMPSSGSSARSCSNRTMNGPSNGPAT